MMWKAERETDREQQQQKQKRKRRKSLQKRRLNDHPEVSKFGSYQDSPRPPFNLKRWEIERVKWTSDDTLSNHIPNHSSPLRGYLPLS